MLHHTQRFAAPIYRRNPQHQLRRFARSSRSMAALHGDVFFLDSFAIRQWDDASYSGTRISYDKAEFVRKVHEFHKNGAGLVDGYAPFCKHVFVPNFVGAKLGALEITPANRHLLQSAYSKRRPEELAVLTRYGARGMSACCAWVYVPD